MTVNSKTPISGIHMSHEEIKSIEVSLARIEQKVDSNDAKTERIEEILSGNGNPDTGLQSRMVRVESKMKIIMWVMGTIGAAIVGFLVTAIMSLINKSPDSFSQIVSTIFYGFF